MRERLRQPRVVALIVTFAVAVAAEAVRQAAAGWLVANAGPVGAFLGWRWTPTVILALGMAVMLLIVVRPELISPGEPLYVRGRRIKITEIIGPDGWIRDRIFEDCQIFGPAVLVPQGPAGMFYACKWAGSPESLFIEIPPVDRPINGVVALENCVMRRCRLFQLSLMGSPQNIAEWKQGFGLA